MLSRRQQDSIYHIKGKDSISDEIYLHLFSIGRQVLPFMIRNTIKFRKIRKYIERDPQCKYFLPKWIPSPLRAFMWTLVYT